MLPLMQVAATNKLVLQKQQYIQRQSSQISMRRRNSSNMRNKNNNNLNYYSQLDNFNKHIDPPTSPPFNQNQIRVSRLMKAVNSFELKNKIHDGTSNCNTCNYRTSLTNNDKTKFYKRIETGNRLDEAIAKLSGGIGQIIAHHAL